MPFNLKHFFAPPVFADDEKTRVGRLLHIILLACLGASFLIGAQALLTVPVQTGRFLIACILLLFCTTALFLLRHGYVQSVSIGLITVLWLLFVLLAGAIGGSYTSGFSGLILIIMIAGLLLGVRAGVVVAILSVVAATLLAAGESIGELPLSPREPVLLSTWISNSLFFLLAAVLLYLALDSLYTTLNRAHSSEAALQRINRAYQVLSNCNQTLIRATDEHTLLSEICRIIIDVGGRRFAWVGLIDETAPHSLRPVAYAGHEDSYLDKIYGMSPDCDPALTTLRSGKVTLLRDVLTKPCPTSEDYGYDSIIALPLTLDGTVLGTLNVYSAYKDAFDAEEIMLLAELAGDIAFGIQTLRTRAEREEIAAHLAEQHHLLRTLIDSLPDIIFLKDTQGRYVLVNETYAQYAGTTQDTIIGKTALDLYPPEEAEFYHAFDLNNMQQGTPLVDMEIESIRGDTGESRWLLMNQVLLRNAAGEITGLLGIGHDITDRMRMEEELRYQASLIENASDAIVSVSADLRVLSWNKAAELMYEIPAVEASGRHLPSLAQTVYHDQPREEAFRQTMEEGEWSGEITQTTHTGKTMHVQVAASALRDSQGRVSSIILINRDITSQKQAQQALRQAEQERERFFTLSADLLCITDMDGLLLRVNPSFERILGYPVDDIELTSYDEYVHPDDLRHTRSMVDVVINTQPAPLLENRVRHRDGSYRWINWSIIAYTDEQVIYLAGRDITDQKQVQEALLHQQRLEMELQQQKDLAATRNRFMSMVSHEFRTPLSVIQSSTELIDYYWDRMTAEKRQTHVRRMRAQVSRLDGLIEDFALAIRAESGHLTFQPALMNIELYCRDIFEEFEMTLNDHHQLVFESSDQIDEVQADRLLLGYILRNLLSNAIKYSPEGGEVALRLIQDRQAVKLEIEDEGIGIPPEDMAHLFEPYHRASNVGSIRGTGLGLKIVKDCVELHGGHIAVTSELNQGTTFTLTLPIL